MCVAMQSFVILCAFALPSLVAGNFASITASNDLVVACEQTNLHNPDVVHIMKSGVDIGTIDLPPDLDSTNWKQSVCDSIEGGMVLDSTASTLYVAMDDMYGKSSFGASLIKIDMATLKIVSRLKMPPGGRWATQGATPSAMVMIENDTLLLSDRQGRFHAVDLKTFNFTKTVSLPDDLCEDYRPEARSIAYDSEHGIVFLNVCDSVHRMSLDTMTITSSLKASVAGKLLYKNNTLFAYADVSSSGYYEAGTPQFIKISVANNGDMSVADELSLAAVEAHQFFGDGGAGTYFVDKDMVVFSGAAKAPCPDLPGQQCPHYITKLAALKFPQDGDLQFGSVVDFSANFTGIDHIVAKSSTTLIMAGYSGTPMKYHVVEVAWQGFSDTTEAESGLHLDPVVV